mmetsp:Transcript_3359/g.8948  ORF Transcript_3359/g.8948 Transcript_3359/m.8948 type:complete len:87 (+) Transcript_3359:919-1179(+)
MKNRGGKVDLELDAPDGSLLTKAPTVVHGWHQDQLGVPDIEKIIDSMNIILLREKIYTSFRSVNVTVFPRKITIENLYQTVMELIH